MRFNLANQNEVQTSALYLSGLAKNKRHIEIKPVPVKRTHSQNAYLHLILGAFANHFGYTLEEAKQLYKEVNADIYKYEKKQRTFWRSSADISKEDMAKSIDRFRLRSEENGYPLPLATDQAWLAQIEAEIERSHYYL